MMIPDKLILDIVSGVYGFNEETLKRVCGENDVAYEKVMNRISSYIRFSRDLYFNKDFPADTWKTAVRSRGYSPVVLEKIINLEVKLI